MNRLKILGLGILLMGSTQVFAQEQSTTASSNPSARPIPDSDMMYRKTVWRTVDLREKQNRPFLSNNLEITKLIIDAVKRGELPIYTDDNLTTTLTQEEFSKKLLLEAEPAPLDPALAGGDDWGNEGGGATTPVGPAEFFPKDLYTLWMKEDAIFDKKRSRMYHDIKSITIIVPAEKNAKQINDPIATFKYSDLVKVFRDHPKEAIWFNPQNDAKHLNFADAFDLRLFSSYITKVSNPANSTLEDIYGGPQQGVLAAQTTAEQMIEYEYNLWSF